MKRATGVIVAIACALVIAGVTASSASAAEVKQFGVGAHHSCAITKAGKAQCWGGDPGYELSDEPKAEFTKLTVGNYHTCGLKRSGKAVCWGDDAINSTKAPGTWKMLDSGYYGNCGVRPSGKVECYGYDVYRDGVPGGKFRSVSLGGEFACGLRPSGKIACWGGGDDGELMPPTGEFESLSTGAEAACAMKRSGRLACWGSNEDGLVSQTDGKVAGKISMGDANFCGLAQGGGSLTCGGNTSEPVASPPSGRFVDVDLYAYSDHACALRRDRTLACWGQNFFGETDVPAAFLPTER